MEELAVVKAILWGGTDGEGLVHSVAKLAISVTELANMVRSKADIAVDDDGEPISLRKVSKDVSEIKEMIRKFMLRALWWAVPIAIATTVLGLRSLQVHVQGHV